MRSLILSTSILMYMATIGLCSQTGQVLFDYTHDASDGSTDSGKFELTLAHFTWNEIINDELSYEFQLDVARLNGAALEAHLKSANMSLELPLGKLTFGLQGMNIFGIQEGNWGNRLVAKSAMDEHGISGPADLGLAYDKTIIDQLNLNLMLTNGPGFQNPENDKYKKISLRLMYGSANISQVDGYNLGVVFSHEPYKTAGDETEVKSLLGLFGGWSSNGIRIAGEFNKFSDAGSEIDQQIISAYANYMVPIRLKPEIFAYLDVFDPNQDLDDDGSSTIILGFILTPSEGLKIAPNIKTVSYQASGSESDQYYGINFEFIADVK
jgi:hypothetical protein